MKHVRMTLAGLVAGLVLVLAVEANAVDPDTLYIRHMEGIVELAEAGSPQWMEAAVNTPLTEGDTVRTGASGKAELFLKDGSVVRVGRSSVMRIIAVEPKGVQFKLDGGTAYIVAKGSKDIPVFFDTPSAVLSVATPATMRVDVYEGAISEVSVYKGEVYAAQQKGRMPVRAGERLVLRADGSSPVLAGLRAGDDWLRWNADRDRATLAAYDATESYTYLPDELKTYSSDLDANGQWVYTPEYNYVWVPTVITVSTWSPYRFGRWVWIRGSYVWVGYEPWGWAPYHYGRWVHHRHAGWCWVPPPRGHVRWEPAHVAWVHSSRHVGWVPLAPGETYDRRRAPVVYQTNNYSIYNNVTLERSVSTARTAYKNAAVTNSVVTVERAGMLRAKAVNVNLAKTGPMPLKKVSLPANAMPAKRLQGIQDRRTAGTAAAVSQTGAAPARGITAESVQPKDAPVATQKTVSTPPAPVGRTLPPTVQRPAASLNARIQEGRTANPPPPSTPAPPGQGAARSFEQRIGGGGSADMPRAVAPAAPAPDARREVAVRNTVASPQTVRQIGTVSQERRSSPTAGQARTVERPAEPAVRASAGDRGRVSVPSVETPHPIAAPANRAPVNASVGRAVQSGSPSAPPPRQPVAAHKENPAPQAKKQNAPQAKTENPSPAAPPAPAKPAAVTADRDENSKGTMDKGNKAHIRQGAPVKPPRN
jgi:hypothetical protein